MIPLRKTAALLVCIVLCLGILAGCVGGSLPTSATTTTAEKLPGELRVTNAYRLTLAVRDRFRLVTNLDGTYGHRLTWEVTGGAVSVDGDGIVTALREGTAAVTVRLDHLYDTVLVTVIPEGEEPPPPATPPEGFAASYEEAIRRSERGEVSGFTDLPEVTVEAYEKSGISLPLSSKNTARFEVEKKLRTLRCAAYFSLGDKWNAPYEERLATARDYIAENKGKADANAFILGCVETYLENAPHEEEYTASLLRLTDALYEDAL